MPNANDANPCRMLDLKRSRFPFLSRFFGKYKEAWFKGPTALIDAIKSSRVDSSAPDYLPDLRRVCSGWLYWTYFVKGYIEFLEAGIVTDSNTYFIQLPRIWEITRFDLNMEAIFRNPELLRERVETRFMFGRWVLSGAPHHADPVAVIGGECQNSNFSLFDKEGFAVPCSRVDGVHRLFWIVLSGEVYFPYLLVSDDSEIAPKMLLYWKSKENRTASDYFRLGQAYFAQGDLARSKACFLAVVTGEHA